jgi:hypothetical protein
LTHGEAGFSSSGGISLDRDAENPPVHAPANGYGLVEASSANAAVYDALKANATVENNDGETQDYSLDDSAPFRVDTFSALDDQIGNTGHQGFNPGGSIASDQRLITLEDQYYFESPDDDFYWEVQSKPVTPKLIAQNEAGESVTDSGTLGVAVDGQDQFRVSFNTGYLVDQNDVDPEDSGWRIVKDDGTTITGGPESNGVAWVNGPTGGE